MFEEIRPDSPMSVLSDFELEHCTNLTNSNCNHQRDTLGYPNEPDPKVSFEQSCVHIVLDVCDTSPLTPQYNLFYNTVPCKLMCHTYDPVYKGGHLNTPYLCEQKLKSENRDGHACGYNFHPSPADLTEMISDQSLSFEGSFSKQSNEHVFDFNKDSHLLISGSADLKDPLDFRTEANSPHPYVLEHNHQPCQQHMPNKNRIPWDVNQPEHADIEQCSTAFKKVESSGVKENRFKIQSPSGGPSLSENAYTQSFLEYWLSELKLPSSEGTATVLDNSVKYVSSEPFANRRSNLSTNKLAFHPVSNRFIAHVNDSLYKGKCLCHKTGDFENIFHKPFDMKKYSGTTV